MNKQILKTLLLGALLAFTAPLLAQFNFITNEGVVTGYSGSNANATISDLARIANDARQPQAAARAMMALSAIGPEALPAVESRLANTNFPFPPDAAVRIYLRTRTSKDEHQLTADVVRPILIELQTNANPLLSKGAAQLLNLMESPSSQERGQTKSISEALLDLRTERQFGSNLKPGWNIPEWAKLSSEQQRDASNVVQSAMTSPPASPNGDEAYPYPLQPGTAAWNYAEAKGRLQSVEIPKSWREHASSWQLFRSAIGNPYFRTIYLPGYDIGDCYNASRSGTVSILQEVDASPEFGTNVLRWLSELDLAKMAASECEKPYEPCHMDYIIVWHMAGLDSALCTLDVGSRQRLYRLAVWDADHFLSQSENIIAIGPVGLIYTLAQKPESFRGKLPPEAVLSSPLPNKSPALGLANGIVADQVNLRTAVAAAKAALGLKERPVR